MNLIKWLRPISASTPPAVVALWVESGQRQKVANFSDDLEQLLLRHKDKGLDPRRIAKAISNVAKAFEKLAA